MKSVIFFKKINNYILMIFFKKNIWEKTKKNSKEGGLGHFVGGNLNS